MGDRGRIGEWGERNFVATRFSVSPRGFQGNAHERHQADRGDDENKKDDG